MILINQLNIKKIVKTNYFLVTLTLLTLFSCVEKSTTDSKSTIPTTPQITEYTITFDSKGGSVIADQVVVQGLTATKLTPTLSGSTFDSWYTDEAFSNKFDFTTPIRGNITLYAKWSTAPNSPTSFTVTFNSKGGTDVQSQTVISNNTAQKPNNPTLSSSTFDSWYTDEAFSNKFDFTTPIRGNITLYAKWSTAPNSPTSFTVTFNSKGGTDVQSQTVISNNTAQKPNNPTLSSSTFDSWYTDEAFNNKFDFTTPIRGDTTLYAKWSTTSSIGTPITDTCGYPSWDSTKTYSTKDTEVFYDSKIYKNAWWANPNEKPGKNGVWKFVTDCSKNEVVLTSPNNAAVDVSKTPKLVWSPPPALSSNTSGITYTVFLGENNPPTTKIIENTANNEYTVSSSLKYEKDYFWKVTALKDGNIYTSRVFKYTTLDDPDLPPVINLIKPATTNQNQFSETAQTTLAIEVKVTDAETTVASVTGKVNDTVITLSKSGTTYTGTYTTSSFGRYKVSIIASDDGGRTSAVNRTINLIDKNNKPTYTPVPERVLVGYWHNWEEPATYVKLRDIPEEYNVVNISFIETQGNYYTPHFAFQQPKNPANSGYTETDFSNDIKLLQSQGRKVLISIGGQNGHVELKDDTKKDVYVSGLIDIVEKFGFDGIDIDYEGGTISTLNNNGATGLDMNDITSEELKRNIKAIREVYDYFGTGFMITAAPEIAYVQDGKISYPGSGQFLTFIHNLRDILTFLQVQLYNFGSSYYATLDGRNYAKGTPDMIVAATEVLIHGFDLSTTGIHFSGLREDQVVVGLMASPSAGGPGYYLEPATVTKAMNYLLDGTKSDLSYTLQKPAGYPGIRGLMTWSVNWDKTTDGGTAVYEFANNYKAIFGNR